MQSENNDNPGRDDAPLFPWNSVVGVVDDAAHVDETVAALKAAGFADDELAVLGGQDGIEKIDEEGRHRGLRARLFRMMDSLGAEQDETRRHVEELKAGHFLVIASADDEAAVARAGQTMADHGGHYINHYSRWTTEQLLP